MQPILTHYQEVTSESTPLKKRRCNLVILTASPLLLNDTRIAPDVNGTYKTTGKEILWGVNGEAMHTLYIGESVQIPVQNLNQISVKAITPAAGQIVVFSCFQAEKEQI